VSTPLSRYAAAFLAALADVPSSEAVSLFAAGAQYAALLEKEEELRRFFLSPSFSLEEKRALFTEIAERLRIAAPLRNLFLALLASRRPLLWGPVIAETERRYRAARGIVDIEVRSAVPLDEETLGRLRAILEKKFGTPLFVRPVVDAGLLGGIVVRHGNTVYDASLKNHLRLLADSLKKGEQTHA